MSEKPLSSEMNLMDKGLDGKLKELLKNSIDDTDPFL